MSSVFGAHVPGIQLDMSSLNAALKLADLRPGEIYVELGSGIGKGLVRAAAKYRAIARGVELMPHAVTESRQRAEKAGVSEQVFVTHGDLMEFDTSDADVVLAFLGSAFYDLIAPKLERELKPTARVILMGWQMHGWELEDHSEDMPIQSFLYRPNANAQNDKPQPGLEKRSSSDRIARLVDVTRGPLRGTQQWVGE